MGVSFQAIKVRHDFFQFGMLKAEMATHEYFDFAVSRMV